MSEENVFLKNIEESEKQKNEEKRKHGKPHIKDSTAWKVYRFFLPTAWRKYKGYFLLRLIMLLEQTTQPFVDILLLPLIVEELVGDRNIEKIAIYAVALALSNAILFYIDGVVDNFIQRYSERFSRYYQEMASKRIMELDFQVTEDKKALDQVELAKEGLSWYSGGLDGIVSVLFNVVQNVITLLGISTIIFISAPWLLLIIFSVLFVTGVVNNKINQIEQEEYKNMSKINRVFGYLGWQVVDFRYGKDIRLYGAKDMLVSNYNRYSDQMVDTWYSLADRQLGPSLLIDICDVVRDFGTYLYVGFLAVTGKISLGVTTQLFTAGGQLYGQMRQLVGNIQDIIKRTNYAYEYVKLMEYPERIPKGDKQAKGGSHTFEFKDVVFAYPGSDVKVLNGVNLTIRVGEHLSIVGRNGAGKTTLIKLMCRLYDPTSGTILMDGIDIKDYDYKSYMQEFAPVFQDFKLFAFTFKENVMLDGAVSGKSPDDIFEKIGLKEKIDSLDKGADTYIFKHYDEDGIEPSGGEQQKLAIGRALYKNAPVVILDEPTAALDPVAEYEIYRQFEDLVGGKTAVYISHRLSSCQFCDNIAVFSDGVVAEYGTHDELVGKENGIYAEMFAAQAQYYTTA